MRIKRTVMAGAALAALTLTTAPVAQAAEPSPEGGIGAQGPDGKLYAWGETHRGGGEPCSWSSNSADWGGTWWGCSDWASSLHNNGYPGAMDDVWVYEHTGYEGGRRGVHNGVYLTDLHPYKYDGSNVRLNNTISSHQWTNL
ncbi:hypothetical protein [Streptomyces luteolus]|uniref:Peptidase inhibitor family I36 n=1 Tax=Streptomyces luteolus TaxID=3043615 RepID=A0ABT6SQ45_9ACTN|nr:hypothetical protein [Streptomyces sp. B-S-A12]MDI3417738.1 hypothetical protein [Streptomyces sp. B-S-A12]